MNITTYLNLLDNSLNSSFNIINYIGGSFNLFPQLGIEGSPNISTKLELKNQNKIQLKWLNEHTVKRNIEPRKLVTTWYLSCLYYDNIPIAILRNTEFTEDIFSKIIVIDKNQYYYAAYYLIQFLKEDPGPNLEPYDIVGSFSGDITPNIKGVKIKYYDLNNMDDINFVNSIIGYTIKSY